MFNKEVVWIFVGILILAAIGTICSHQLEYNSKERESRKLRKAHLARSSEKDSLHEVIHFKHQDHKYIKFGLFSHSPIIHDPDCGCVQ